MAAELLDRLVEIYSHPDFWLYVAIPLIAGAVGWGTNWLALKLSFYPVEPIGWPPFFGWQGVIPSKSVKMSNIFVENSLAKLGSTKEIFEAMEAEKMRAHFIHQLMPRVDDMIDDLMRDTNRVLWENLPRLTRELVYARARWQIPRIADKMMDEITERSEELVDLNQMSIDLLSKDKTLLNHMFLECGKAEFDFVIKAGLYLGFLFGVIQMFAWIYYPSWWVLPVFGFIVGATTNWIALNVIFRPLEPTKVGPFTMQGLFIKRQKQVSATFARLSTREVLTIGNLMHNVLNGPNADKTKRIIRRHLRPAVDATMTRVTAQVMMGPTAYAEMKDKLEERTLDLSAEIFDDKKFNEERAAHVARMLYERMAAMTPEEYQDLIRPAFKEDEWILIAIGGVLGFGTGIAQLVFLFGQSLLG